MLGGNLGSLLYGDVSLRNFEAVQRSNSFKNKRTPSAVFLLYKYWLLVLLVRPEYQCLLKALLYMYDVLIKRRVKFLVKGERGLNL